MVVDSRGQGSSSGGLRAAAASSFDATPPSSSDRLRTSNLTKLFSTLKDSLRAGRDTKKRESKFAAQAADKERNAPARKSSSGVISADAAFAEGDEKCSRSQSRGYLGASLPNCIHSMVERSVASSSSNLADARGTAYDGEPALGGEPASEADSVCEAGEEQLMEVQQLLQKCERPDGTVLLADLEVQLNSSSCKQLAMVVVHFAPPSPEAMLPGPPSMDPFTANTTSESNVLDSGSYSLGHIADGFLIPVSDPCPEGFSKETATPTASSPALLLQPSASSAPGGLLEAMLYNTAAANFLGVSSMAVCQGMLRHQLTENPSLLLIMEELIKGALAGSPTAYSQYIPSEFCRAAVGSMAAPNLAVLQQAFIQVQFGACVVDDGAGAVVPVLLLVYRQPGAQAGSSYVNLPSLKHTISRLSDASLLSCPSLAALASFAVRPQLQPPPSPLSEGDSPLNAFLLRQYLILSHIPSIVTIFSNVGCVLFQNGQSMKFMGKVVDCADASLEFLSSASCPTGNHMLRKLFVLDPTSLENLWTAVKSGQSWSGLLQMPSQPQQMEEPHFLESDLSVHSSLRPAAAAAAAAAVALSSESNATCPLNVAFNARMRSSGTSADIVQAQGSCDLGFQTTGTFMDPSLAAEDQALWQSHHGSSGLLEQYFLPHDLALSEGTGSHVAVKGLIGNPTRSFPLRVVGADGRGPTKREGGTPGSHPRIMSSDAIQISMLPHTRKIVHLSKQYVRREESMSGSLRAVRLISHGSSPMTESRGSWQASTGSCNNLTMLSGGADFSASPQRSPFVRPSLPGNMGAFSAGLVAMNKSLPVSSSLSEPVSNSPCERSHTVPLPLTVTQQPPPTPTLPPLMQGQQQSPPPMQQQQQQQQRWEEMTALSHATETPASVSCPNNVRWHEVEANIVTDPVTGLPLLLLVQNDVTSRVTADLVMKQVLDLEHRLLEQIFPRHVLVAMASGMLRSASVPDLASQAAAAAAAAAVSPGNRRSLNINRSVGVSRHFSMSRVASMQELSFNRTYSSAQSSTAEELHSPAADPVAVPAVDPVAVPAVHAGADADASPAVQAGAGAGASPAVYAGVSAVMHAAAGAGAGTVAAVQSAAVAGTALYAGVCVAVHAGAGTGAGPALEAAGGVGAGVGAAPALPTVAGVCTSAGPAVPAAAGAVAGTAGPGAGAGPDVHAVLAVAGSFAGTGTCPAVHAGAGSDANPTLHTSAGVAVDEEYHADADAERTSTQSLLSAAIKCDQLYRISPAAQPKSDASSTLAFDAPTAAQNAPPSAHPTAPSMLPGNQHRTRHVPGPSGYVAGPPSDLEQVALDSRVQKPPNQQISWASLPTSTCLTAPLPSGCPVSHSHGGMLAGWASPTLSASYVDSSIPMFNRLSRSDINFLEAQSSMSRDHEAVTVLFADIVSFTDMCNKVSSPVVMNFLNCLFSKFDALVEFHDVYKVETIGDCYMVAGGLIRTDPDGSKAVTSSLDSAHAAKVFALAVDMLKVAGTVMLPSSGEPVQLRIGIHSGAVSSGVVGQQMPRFCLFGDTVNTASRMESNSLPGHINCSAATITALNNVSDALPGWLPPRSILVKGKGMMETQLWSLAEAELCSSKASQSEAHSEAPYFLFSQHLEQLDEEYEEQDEMFGRLSVSGW